MGAWALRWTVAALAALSLTLASAASGVRQAQRGASRPGADERLGGRTEFIKGVERRPSAGCLHLLFQQVQIIDDQRFSRSALNVFSSQCKRTHPPNRQ